MSISTEHTTEADAPVRRPFAIPLFYVLYLQACGLFLGIASGHEEGGDSSSMLRAVYGLFGVLFLLACAGLILRTKWARWLCIVIHGAAFPAIVIHGIVTWPGDGSETRQVVWIVAAGGFQLGCLGVLFRPDVVKWFAARASNHTFTPAK